MKPPIIILILLGALVTMALPPSAVANDPFTPDGASRIDIKVGATTGFLFKPTAGSTKKGRPWLWYAPTRLDLPPDHQYPNVRTHWLFTKLLARGVWIAGVDVGESYGGPAGRSIFTEFYKAVTSRYHLSHQPCFLAQSRGGLMDLNWAEENPGDVRCIAGIYPVLSLAKWPAAGTPEFSQAAAAYGYTSATEYQKQLIQLSPIANAGPLAKAKIPIFIIHGDSDRTVPLQENSQPFAAAYKALGGAAELVIVPGKGHEEVDEYFQSDRLLDFLLHQLVNATGP
jgi:pimeloyl-ACP methyl ester carboxylesterase